MLNFVVVEVVIIVGFPTLNGIFDVAVPLFEAVIVIELVMVGAESVVLDSAKSVAIVVSVGCVSNKTHIAVGNCRLITR